MENGLGLEEICVSLFLIRMIEFLNIFEEKSLQTKRLGEMVLLDTLKPSLKNIQRINKVRTVFSVI